MFMHLTKSENVKAAIKSENVYAARKRKLYSAHFNFSPLTVMDKTNRQRIDYFSLEKIKRNNNKKLTSLKWLVWKKTTSPLSDIVVQTAGCWLLSYWHSLKLFWIFISRWKGVQSNEKGLFFQRFFQSSSNCSDVWHEAKTTHPGLSIWPNYLIIKR